LEALEEIQRFKENDMEEYKKRLSDANYENEKELIKDINDCKKIFGYTNYKKPKTFHL